MLRIIRIVLALLSITMVTLLFLDFTGTARHLWPWMAEAQFMPALLSLNIIAIVGILAGTLVFGRLYCSVICPLGIFQDIVSRFRIFFNKITKRRSHLRYSRRKQNTRLITLTVFIVFLVLGLVNVLASSIASILEPYSAYGRISSQIFAPAYNGVNNLFASAAESGGSYMFYRVVTYISLPILAIAVVTLIAILIFAWTGGRDYCNKICPAGTVLGYLAQYSMLCPVIDTNKCVRCGKCSHHCKGRCINVRKHTIDYTRCVTCFDCIESCGTGAISYKLRWSLPSKPTPDNNNHHHHHHHHHHDEDSEMQREVENPQTMPDISGESDNSREATDAGRRAFLAAAGFAVGAIATKAVTTDGGLTPLLDKVPAHRKVVVLPAGAVDYKNMLQRCISCQLCVSACPENVLVPRTSFEGFMQPTLEFTKGYCRPECTACADICPTDAIQPIDTALKSSTKIGSAIVDLKTCLSATGASACGSCARHCPAGAITMAPVEKGSANMMPVVSQSKCIGCGSCEYHCPVGTVSSTLGVTSAIHVEGLETQHLI